MANGSYTVVVDGQKYNVQIAAGNVDVQVVASAPVASVAVAAPIAPSVAPKGTVCAELPATVFNIVSEVGATVNTGDKIMILEAMKMEIDVVAPCAGKVTAILVHVNDKVEVGQALAIVE